MKIGKISLNGDLLMAPLAGYTDVAFRRLVKSYGASLTCTEMISAKALTYHNRKTIEMLVTSPEEDVRAVQLFGHEPSDFEQAIKLGYCNQFDIIDINMGCPVGKVVRSGEGSALLKDEGRAAEIVGACVRAFSGEVTVKMRIGFDEEHINAIEFARRMERAGASALTVHGRTAKQMYLGQADRKTVRETAAAVNIPVFSSGDVVDVQSYDEARQGVSGVMIGRGALANPSIFAILNGRQGEDKLTIVKKHYQLMKEYFDERYIVSALRRFSAFYLKGEHGKKPLKCLVNTLENSLDIIAAYEKEYLKS